KPGRARPQPRLLGVEFPRMKVEDRWLALGVQSLDRAAQDAVRPEPGIKAAPYRHIDGGDAQRGNGQLPQPLVRLAHAWQPVWNAPARRHPIPIIVHRKDARIITQ